MRSMADCEDNYLVVLIVGQIDDDLYYSLT